MNLKQNFPFALATVALALSGCGGSGTDPTKLDGDATSATFQMKLADPAAAAKRLAARALTVDAAGVTIAEAHLNVKRVDLKLPDGIRCADAGFVPADRVTCEEETELEDGGEVLESTIRLSGPFVFDLLTGVSTPSIADLAIPSGIYREIEIEVEKSDALGGHSFHVAGTYVDGASVTHDFSMNFDFSEELEIESAAGIEVAEGTVNDFVASLDAASWFAGVDLTDCDQAGDVVLDESSDSGESACEALEETVRENIKNSFEIEDEADDSGETDDSGNDSPSDAADDSKV